MGFARQKLSGNPQRVSDAEDMALNAFHRFCKGVLDDRFQKLNERNGLWQVLAMITTRKALSQVERKSALESGGGAVAGGIHVPQHGQLERCLGVKEGSTTWHNS